MQPEHPVARPENPHAGEADHDAGPGPEPDPLDDAARRSTQAANLLGLDGEVHQRMRRGITSRFSVKQVRSRREWVHAMVADQLRRFVALGSPADVFENYATPISVRTHCAVLGVPETLVPEFARLFVRSSSTQSKFDFIRLVFAEREKSPGDDLISDLIASDFTRIEAEGLAFQVMTAGRDSVAYLISTAMVALLTHPKQAELLRREPERMPGAIEEFMRTGAMFLTLFPRTATEDVDLGGVHITAGRTVSVSPVGANRDPKQWDRADELDIERDAFGHLGFGHGPHGCVGQQLARLEIAEGVSQLLAVPGLTLIDAEQIRPMPFANPVATYEAGAVVVGWTEQPAGPAPAAA